MQIVREIVDCDQLQPVPCLLQYRGLVTRQEPLSLLLFPGFQLKPTEIQSHHPNSAKELVHRQPHAILEWTVSANASFIVVGTNQGGRCCVKYLMSLGRIGRTVSPSYTIRTLCYWHHPRLRRQHQRNRTRNPAMNPAANQTVDRTLDQTRDRYGCPVLTNPPIKKKKTLGRKKIHQKIGILSAIINFAKFREEQLPVFDKHVECSVLPLNI
jgi:hypothetical protein